MPGLVPSQVKYSQMPNPSGSPMPAGGAAPGAPAQAVSNLTPQVQASQPPTQPGQLPMKPTMAPSMPKMAEIWKIAGFADEAEKIAASRWRRALRAGELAADDVARLRSAPRPGGGELLDTAREVSGLEKGTEELIRKHKIPVYERDPLMTKDRAVDALKGGRVREALRTGVEAAKGRAIQKATAPWGGGMSMGGRVAIDPEANAFRQISRDMKGGDLSDIERRGADAMLKRHEVRETLEGRKMLKPKKLLRQALMQEKPTRTGWVVGGEPSEVSSEKFRKQIFGDPTENLKIREAKMKALEPQIRASEAMTRAGETVGGKLESVGRRLKKHIPAAGKLEAVGSRTRNIAKEVPADLDKAYEASVPISRTGVKSVGQHASPVPVLEESQNLAMMPELTQRAFKVGRHFGEGPKFARHGLIYGRAPTPQQKKKVMKAWSDYDI